MIKIALGFLKLKAYFEDHCLFLDIVFMTA